MKNIYQETIQAVNNGAKFRVDLVNKSLKVGKNMIIENGKYDGELGIEPQSLEDTLMRIEDLYAMYRNSVPSERSVSYRNYFKALPEHELSDDDLLYGQPRMARRFELELFVLLSVLNKSLYWAESFGNWFWQSELYPELIIFKNWVK